ncbi:MAG: riboflavin biosynthesis protein RibF [Clostridiales bacterium]|nr:riboflavin biosynthesis protein RibF [Clostridiales bacterium]
MTIITQLDELKAPGRAAIALGSFDGLHRGHTAVIQTAVQQKAHGLIPCVAAFDRSPARVLHRQSSSMLMTHSMRCKVLRELGVERLILLPFEEIRSLSPAQFVEDILMKRFGAQYVCCGFNYHFGAGGRADSAALSELCHERGIQASILPAVLDHERPVSSTRIRALIASGDVTSAARLMGRPFTIDFEVISGRRIGHLMGTPTLNQQPPPGFVEPMRGVYASVSRVDGKWLPSVTNFGVKPTVGAPVPLFETWIPNWEGDLYGQQIEVAILSFMRPEQKFSDLDLLRSQILHDGHCAVQIAKDWDVTAL